MIRMANDSPVASRSSDRPSIPSGLRDKGLERESDTSSDIVIQQIGEDIEIFDLRENEVDFPVRVELGEDRIRSVTEEVMMDHIENERLRFQSEVDSVRAEMREFSHEQDDLRTSVSELSSRVGDLELKFEEMESTIQGTNEEVDRLSEFEQKSRKYYAERVKTREKSKRVEAVALSLLGFAVLGVTGAIWNLAPSFYSGTVGTVVLLLLGVVGVGLIGAGIYDIQRLNS